MIVKSIYLENFRNYENQFLALNENINIFYGNNAQGKTNILEALYFCSIGRSFRTYKEVELINFRKDISRIKVVYQKQDRENEIDVLLDKNEKKKIVKLNQIKLNKNSELLGNINVVIFSPDDIIILKQAPTLRRKFLDILISQLKPKYLHELGEYNRILEQRNASLKNKDFEIIDTWNEQLSIAEEKIHKYRSEYIDKIQNKLNDIYPQITNNKENIKISYKTNFETREKFINLLKNKENLDFYRGYTTEGAHREDFEIYVNENMLNIYGSQGQHRTAVLALKIAEMQIIKDEIGENPILLLDDVMSELDNERIDLIFNNVKDYQVIITCTDVNTISKYDNLTKNIKLYNIEDGHVKF